MGPYRRAQLASLGGEGTVSVGLEHSWVGTGPHQTIMGYLSVVADRRGPSIFYLT